MAVPGSAGSMSGITVAGAAGPISGVMVPAAAGPPADGATVVGGTQRYGVGLASCHQDHLVGLQGLSRASFRPPRG
jgi:hypothetical protein